MAGLVNIGEMGALALHILVELAEIRASDQQARLSVGDLAERLGASTHTLHKVAGRLVKAGVLDSSRGASGGLKLDVPPSEITLMQVIEEVDGKPQNNACLFAKRVCPPGAHCPFAALADGIEQQVRDYFLRTTVADLLGKAMPFSITGTTASAR